MPTLNRREPLRPGSALPLPPRRFRRFQRPGAYALGSLCCLSLLCRPARGDEARAHFDRGVALFRVQKLDEARTEFEAASKAAPNDPNSLSYLGLIALRQLRYQDALPPLKQAAQQAPDRTDVHINLGNAYDRLKLYPDALREFNVALSLDPKSASIYYDLGAVQYEMRRLPEAIRSYRKAAQLDPNDPEIQNNLGYALQAQPDLTGAIEAYRRAVNLAPTNGSYLLNLGTAVLAQAHALQGSSRPEDAARSRALMEEARLTQAKAVQQLPTDYAARETYAETLSELGRDADAQNQFMKAGDLKPGDYRALYFLGMTQARLKNFHDCVGTLKRALEARGADRRSVLTLLGYAQVKQSDYGNAIGTYRQLTDLTPDDLSAWNNLGVALQEKRDLDAAVALLDEEGHLGRKGPQLAALRRAVGFINLSLYQTRGDSAALKLAYEAYQQAVKDAPQNPEGHVGLGLAAKSLNSLDEARAAFQTAVDRYAAAYKSSGRSWDRHALTQYADACNDLGAVYQLKNESSQAIARYKMALQIDPNNATAQQNLKRLTGPASDR